MPRPSRAFLSLSLGLALLALPAAADEVVVFAAASLKTALDPIAAGFQDRTGNTVSVSYAGSNALAKQILRGVHYVVTAQKYLSDNARLVSPDASEKPDKKRGGKAIDG